MKHHLNYVKNDPNYILLDKIFKIIDCTNSQKIMASYGIKNINLFILCLKIIFTGLFFDLDINFIVNDLNNSLELRQFFNISSVPKTSQIYNFFGKISEDQILEITNRILKTFKLHRRNRKMTYIIDATPVDLNFNVKRKKRSKEHLKSLDLKWSYSSSQGFYIGFKATVVIEYESAIPVAILIHSGAKHDTKIFDEILQELKRRRLLKKEDTIIFDKGYYSYNNYIHGIAKYNIVPFIFPKGNIKIEKLEGLLSYPLDIYSKNKDTKKLKKSYKNNAKKLIQLIKKWKQYKPIRGKIEDFFKLCKQGLHLKKINKYTPKSVKKITILGVFLAGLITTIGYNKKTDLQTLSES
ncbi:transposase [Methanobrevibacter sp. DSM 116169]|uniref:transposase n=1 Tax=Methanobrevibacter sp. DSM 116169 TaxID=3242727 RepID=UPI0038FCEA74